MSSVGKSITISVMPEIHKEVRYALLDAAPFLPASKPSQMPNRHQYEFSFWITIRLPSMRVIHNICINL